jgi:hypothetical protein
MTILFFVVVPNPGLEWEKSIEAYFLLFHNKQTSGAAPINNFTHSGQR